MKRFIYIIPFLLLALVSCRDFHVNFVGGTVVAEVDGKQLMLSELDGVVPKEYQGADSVAFVDVYIDKWILRQVKLREAERIFVNSEVDIEALVKEYRQLLLIKRLDEHCVSSSLDTIYSDNQIANYYQNNSSNFRLNSRIAKGEVLRVPLDSDQTKKLESLMESNSESKRADMISICEKNDFAYVDLSASWVEDNQILDLLPLVRGEHTDKLLSQRGVHHMSDGGYDYYYQIFDNKDVGDVAPLEWVRSTIRTILITERQQALIKGNEDQLTQQAQEEGVVRRQYKEKEEREKEKE